MPTMQTSVALSIDAMTSGVKPGGVSMITKSWEERSVAYTSRRNSVLTNPA